MKTLTEEALTIFWLFEESNPLGAKGYHEEVPGILAYGYYIRSEWDTPSFPYHIWPTGTLVKDHIYFGQAWQIVEWTINVNHWPNTSDWEHVIKETLLSFHKSGASIAWCGLEGYFADPPSLFDPSEMSGGVYALLMPDLRFFCSAQLAEPFRTLDDSILSEIRSWILGNYPGND